MKRRKRRVKHPSTQGTLWDYKKVSTENPYEILFILIDLGRVKVDVEEGVIYTRKSINKEWRPAYVEPNEHGYLFARFYYTFKFTDASGREYRRPARRGIAVHRVVWMVANGVQSIPQGMDIDHRDTDQTNNRRSNLRLAPSHKNQGRTLTPDSTLEAAEEMF